MTNDEHSNISIDQRAADIKTDVPVSSARAELELKGLQLDPEWKASFFDNRHPMHREAVATQHKLIGRVADARAREAASSRIVAVKTREPTELEKFTSNTENMKKLSDVRHLEHTAKQEEYWRLLEQENGLRAGTLTSSGPKSPSAAKKALEKLEALPNIHKVLTDTRHPQHQEVKTRRAALIEEIAREEAA